MTKTIADATPNFLFIISILILTIAIPPRKSSRWVNLLQPFTICHYWQPNGVRYPLVGGTRQRHFIGINSKPGKVLENAQTPNSRVHALLGGF